jgi:hypothetical protein
MILSTMEKSAKKATTFLAPSHFRQSIGSTS